MLCVCAVQPTLLCFEAAAPEFVGMALEHLDITIREWQALDVQGVTLPAHLMPAQPANGSS